MCDVHQPALYILFIVSGSVAAAAPARPPPACPASRSPPADRVPCAATPNRAGRPICATVPRASYRWGRSLSLFLFFFVLKNVSFSTTRFLNTISPPFSHPHTLSCCPSLSLSLSFSAFKPSIRRRKDPFRVGYAIGARRERWGWGGSKMQHTSM